MAHGDAALEKAGGHRRGRVFLGHRRLAGFEEEEGNAIVTERGGQIVAVDDRAAAFFEFARVVRVFENKRAQTEAAAQSVVGHAFIDSVAVEVDMEDPNERQEDFF